jgi:N-acyl-D-aspartate/D-glutamate deacylase
MGSDDMGGVVISGGRVVDPASGMDAAGDVALLDGKIAAVGTGLGGAERIIDAAAGWWWLPRLHRPSRTRPVDPRRPHAGF